MQHPVGADEGSGGAQRLAAGVEDQDVLPPLERGGKSPSAGTVNAGGMGFVDDEEAIVTIGEGHEFIERRTVAVHGIEALHRDPRPTAAAVPTPVGDRGLEGLDVAMARTDRNGPPARQTVVDGGMDQRVVDDQIGRTGQAREDRQIGGVAGGEIERAIGTEELGRLRFQHLVLGVIAPQQARTAGADRHAARQCRADRLGETG